MEEERRQHQRSTFRTELWIGQDGIFTRTDEHLQELGVGGAFVQSNQLYPIDSVLSLRFRIPGVSNFISCSGIVKNVRPGEGFGVEFLDLSRENLAIIQRQLEAELQPTYSF